MTETTSPREDTAGTGPVRLLAVRDEPLSVDEVYDAVRDPVAGGVVVFVGAVRDSDGGRAVEGLGYSAHPSALARLREVAEGVAQRWPVVALAAVHRVGDLEVGDLAVVVAASAGHRGEAFDAARALIDELKASVPIWKHQEFSDGSQEWVGTP
ncbi:MAG: Molybdopterin synthase catalytic subunit MoaE [uncultured Nocardioidaceae bacterium]|uniref:Molybdopterin synthase catalytic subunit 1 n=1 Tax=uncultured Nocardioidaceae bacterium TaxID=253824 RepID=A0A6J4KVE0_9ACTN|nr:MAG: Molybdopterin synthase catalytic subunit MoaE [uncultured Nocardioidaceae bacterium]